MSDEPTNEPQPEQPPAFDMQNPMSNPGEPTFGVQVMEAGPGVQVVALTIVSRDERTGTGDAPAWLTRSGASSA